MHDDATWRYCATELHPGHWVIEAAGPADTRLRLTRGGRWGGVDGTTQVARFSTREEAEAVLAPWTAWEEEVMLADAWDEIDGECPADRRNSSARRQKNEARRPGRS